MCRTSINRLGRCAVRPAALLPFPLDCGVWPVALRHTHSDVLPLSSDSIGKGGANYPKGTANVFNQLILITFYQVGSRCPAVGKGAIRVEVQIV